MCSLVDELSFLPRMIFLSFFFFQRSIEINIFLARQTCAVMETAGEEGGTKRRSVEYSDVSLFQDDESTEPPRKKQAVGSGNFVVLCLTWTLFDVKKTWYMTSR